tara:strand:- start:374 stop:982 length:609 start_codon:yes stop_codon:yes gene_type:complete
VRHIKETKEKEYKWRFNRVNSKGELRFSHITDETVEDVIKFLDNKAIDYDLTAGAGSTMFWVYFNYKKYCYFSTTGSWAPWNEGGYPSRHFRSKGIEDFYTRFLSSKPTFKSETETKKGVKKVLEDEQIEYKIKKDTVTLTTKAVPRKDGRGDRRRYTYDYIIGTGKWRSMKANGSYNETYYQASSIENFIIKFFRPAEELV